MSGTYFIQVTVYDTYEKEIKADSMEEALEQARACASKGEPVVKTKKEWTALGTGFYSAAGVLKANDY